jgi:N-acetylneuraminate synthase
MLSLAIAYGMGARTFERHIDIPHPTNMSAYNMLPEQCETWFKTFRIIKQMCGTKTERLRVPPCKEIEYINEHVRGLFAKRNLIPGDVISLENFYMAVPTHKGQLSCREVVVGGTVTGHIKKDHPLMLDEVKADYLKDENLIRTIRERGMAFDKNQ